MSKTFSGDWKGEAVATGVGETQVISRMITPQASAAPASLTLTRPALSLPPPGQPAFIVQPHHEMKNYGKSTRPIAPAPPSQAFQNLSTRNVSQTNIPSIITPTLGSGGGSEPTAAAMGTVGHSSISVPVTLSQASVLTLANPSSMGSTATIVQQGLPGSAIPINMLRGPVAQPQSQIQALQNLSHVNRGASTLSVPKSPALLRQTSPAAATTLQITGGLPHSLPLPLARAPLLQTIKTTTAQMARPLSPAVGAQAQAQAQDLSRANFPIHGSITTAAQGPHAMHITLNRVSAPVVGAAINQLDSSSNIVGSVPTIQGRGSAISATTTGAITTSTQSSQNTDLQQQQRISVSLNQESGTPSAGVHHHIHHPLNNPHHTQHQMGRSSTLPFSGPPSSLASLTSNKLQHPGVVQPAKVIPSHTLQQSGAPSAIKSVNLAVPNPVMINSIPACIASPVAPIPIAKVTPQRQHLAGSIPLVSASAHPLISSSASTIASVASSVSTLPTAMAISSLPTSLPLSLTSSLSSSSSFNAAGATIVDSNMGRQELSGLSVSQSSNGGSIIITPDFQARTSNTIIPMTSLSSSVHGPAPAVLGHTDNRSGAHTQQQQQIGIGPDDPMWYQHIVYQHVSQSSLTQPGGATIVRPSFAFLPTQGKVQAQNSNLASLPVSSSSPSLRFSAATVAAAGGTMMMVDPLRQQQQQQSAVLHPAFSGGSIPGGLVAEKLANLSSRQSVSVSGNVYTASVGVQSQMAAAGGGSQHSQSGGLSSVPISNPSSSPRPAILRKRGTEPAGVVIRKPNFNLNQDHRCHSPPRLDTTTTTNSSINSSSSPTPKISTKNFSPMSDSQSSTDTALSSNDATTPTNNHNDKLKGDGEESMENGPSQNSTANNIPPSPAVSHTGSLSEASPRKRARKQSLHANDELKDNTSSEDEQEMVPHKKRDEGTKEQKLREREIERRGEYTDEDGVRWVLDKPKRTFVLLQPDVLNNKTRNNHFSKYGDVKPKDERRPTVNELSNQKGIMQKVNGWKLYFTASQLEELEDFEKEMQTYFSDVQKDLSKVSSPKTGSEDSQKFHEMSQANIQRCELIQTQLSEARASMLRTLEHQPRIHQIVNKHMSKRPIKKKERT